MSICSIGGCDKPHEARSWCAKHYLRWRRHGDPQGGRRRYNDPEEAFAARTKLVGDCLVWVGSTNNKGYGLLSVGAIRVLAHRYAWEREHGPIPEGMEVDHICYNAACVSTTHLRAATRAQNQANQAGARTDNKSSGVRNVYPHGNGWRVRIRKEGRNHNFGSYATIEEASAVAEQKREELFREYAGKG